MKRMTGDAVISNEFDGARTCASRGVAHDDTGAAGRIINIASIVAQIGCGAGELRGRKGRTDGPDESDRHRDRFADVT